MEEEELFIGTFTVSMKLMCTSAVKLPFIHLILFSCFRPWFLVKCLHHYGSNIIFPTCICEISGQATMNCVMIGTPLAGVKEEHNLQAFKNELKQLQWSVNTVWTLWKEKLVRLCESLLGFGNRFCVNSLFCESLQGCRNRFCVNSLLM